MKFKASIEFTKEFINVYIQDSQFKIAYNNNILNQLKNIEEFKVSNKK